MPTCRKDRRDATREHVDHPAHYGGADDPYEAIKVIEAWNLGFALGNAVKYICRHGKKPGVRAAGVRDLEKAAWYLNREIENRKKGGASMRISVLDHGYVALVESWGSDERVVEAARMSTDKGFIGWGGGETPGDEKLLRYLWEHKHATPFEMAGMTVEVAAPIFVFREWHRHRTQSYNEMSARYVPLPDTVYCPTIGRCLAAGGANRQAQSAGASTDDLGAARWLTELDALYAHAQRVYEDGLARGVPKELARLAVTVGRYSRMRASANLRNWLAFEALRLPANAQWEIRQYAAALGTILERLFPRTWALFVEGQRGS